jgi:hypothetical protein
MSLPVSLYTSWHPAALRAYSSFPFHCYSRAKNPSTQPDPDETLCDEDRLEVCEALWDLIREGHLNPGRRKTPQEGWPSVYVTTKGGQYFGNK